MTTTLWSLLAVAAVLAVAAKMLRGGLSGHLRTFMKDGEVGPLVAHIETLPADDQPTAYHTVLTRVWGAYQRRRAAALVREMGMRVGDAAIAQYWIKQVLDIEPEIAREVLDEDWLSAFYVPEVAQQCGAFG